MTKENTEPNSKGTLYFQLSFGVPSICPGMVHSNVIQCGFLDDQCVFLPIFLEAVLYGVFFFMKLFILKEPVNRDKLSSLESNQRYRNTTRKQELESDQIISQFY